MKKYKLTNQALLNKVRLWCILHDVDIYQATQINCCSKCPNWLGKKTWETLASKNCKLEWPKRISTNKEISEIGWEPEDHCRFNFCIEWVKYV
jgi:hypothetical protein